MRSDTLAVATRSVPATGAVATAAVRALLAGPTQAEAASGGLSTAIPGAPETVLVTARVPIERCLFSAFGVWNRFVLRGRYVPSDFADAVAFYRRHPCPSGSYDFHVARDEVRSS